MTDLLLETKLHAPRPRVGSVPRPRLLERLDRGAETRLTLISAPPGFGKTTLLADWLAATPDRGAIAWVSLDAGDSDPRSFWAYVLAAADSAAPGASDAAHGLLEAGRAPIRQVVAALVNDLGRAPKDVVLVLDDYHVVDGPGIADDVAFLIDHMPTLAHVVMTTRADPALPLARLRARGELVEIRAADLRFTPDEAAAYLNGSMGLGLSEPDVAALEGRTEGWVAALQLAALSLQGRRDAAGFISAFAGDDRFVVDYLAEEVLRRQPDGIRTFLEETSILARLTGSLCDAVTGQADGRAMLEALDRANLFVIPLDDRRRWYRYHHLFADVLRAHLLDERPHDVPTLHRRASEWFEGHGEPAEAIAHALAAGDVERAADLIEINAHDLRQHRQELTLRRWLDGLPDSVFDTRPMLAIAHVGALLASGEVGRVEVRLTAAERWVAAARDEDERGKAIAAGMVVRHMEALAHLPSAIALYRAGLAQMRGDTASTIVHARAALAAAGDDQHLEHGGAAALVALASWTDGDLDAALAAWPDSVAHLELAGHQADVLGVSISIADVLLAQGRLRDARRTFEEGLRLGMPPGGPPLRGAADMHVGLAEICREMNDLAAARGHLDAAAELGDALGLPQNPYRWRVTMARLRQADGDLDAAVELLDDAARVYDGDFSPDVRPIAATRARLRLAQGRIADARAWVHGVGLSADDPLSYLREYEHATLVRLLLAEGIRDRDDATVDAAIGLAERLLASAETGGRNGSAIDILIALALALQARERRADAAEALDRALALAAPEGYVRIFLDEGDRVTALLASATKRQNAPSYARELLVASGAGDPSGPRERPAGLAARQPLLEPLSERELEVLRYLRSDLDGPDIARELSVSLNTLRTHTKNVYAKLGVNSRRAAVRRAVDLGVLPSTGDARPSI